MPRPARDRNLYAVLNGIRTNGKLSRTEIAALYSIDRKSVSHITDRLLSDSYVTEAGLKDSSTGRKQRLLQVNDSHSNYIGIDVGSTHVSGALLDFTANVLDWKRFEIRPNLPAELILKQAKAVVEHLRGSSKLTAEIQRIGICVPGYVDIQKGISVRATSFSSWANVHVKESIETESGLPVLIEEGTRAHGICVKWKGSGKSLANFVVVGAGYGIGAAIFIDHRLYEGTNNKAGELGHTVVKCDGVPCTCGNAGCLETIASGRAIEKRAARGIESGESQTLYDLTHGDASHVTAHDVAVAASMGDAFAVSLLEEAGRSLGLALANVAQILNPSHIIITGGLKHAGPPFIDALKSELKEHLITHIADDLQIEVSQIGPEIGAQGAGIFAMQRNYGFPYSLTNVD